MLSGLNSHYFVVFFGLSIAVATVQFRYHQIANVLKWLALTLFAYVITGFVIGPFDQGRSRHICPNHCRKAMKGGRCSSQSWGTTISPYLFFWQSSQGGRRRKGHWTFGCWPGEQVATRREIGVRKMDVGIGTFFFEPGHVFHHFEHGPHVARTWHNEHRDHEAGSRGTVCRWPENSLTFSLPSGSSVSAFSPSRLSPVRPRTLSRRHLAGDRDLTQKFSAARTFYGVVILSTLMGVALDFAGVNPGQTRFIGPRSSTALACAFPAGWRLACCLGPEDHAGSSRAHPGPVSVGLTQHS